VKRRQGNKINTPVVNGQHVGVGVPQDYDDTIMESEEQDGDLKFLQEARAAMADVCTMLGANAPKQLKIGLGVQARLDVPLDDMDECQLGGYMGELMKVTGMLLEGGSDPGIIDVEAIHSVASPIIHDDEANAPGSSE
jgi:hypothetical protein